MLSTQQCFTHVSIVYPVHGWLGGKWNTYTFEEIQAKNNNEGLYLTMINTWVITKVYLPLSSRC